MEGFDIFSEHSVFANAKKDSLVESWRLELGWKSFCRLFFEWFFRKDYCFSRDLQSTIQGDYSFYGL